MATFWIWGMRNPAVLIAGLVTASGFYGVADWSITLVIVLALGVFAEFAGVFGRRARAQRDRDKAVRAAMRDASLLREQLRDRPPARRAA
jgi:hypothetical protein